MNETHQVELLARINGTVHVLSDCCWVFRRPCGCPCQILSASAELAGAAHVWKEIYACDKRLKRRIDYAKRDGFRLELEAHIETEATVYPVSGPCAHGMHVPGMQRVVLEGEKFGRLTAVVRRDPGQPSVSARCECGTDVLISIGQWGITRSCGCLRRETTIKRSTKHGMAGTSEYDTWSAMVQRTTNPKNARYADYGERGIGICERWLDFANFYADMGPRPEGRSLDRIDNDLGYSPENCRWATWVEQRGNQRPHRQRTHCKRGHEFSPSNTRINPNGSRACRACDRERTREYKGRKAEAA